MEFINPWDNIKIKLLNTEEDIQYFDSRIHIIYVLVGAVKIQSQNYNFKLKKDDFCILSKTEKYECQIENKSKVFYFTLDYFTKNNSTNHVYAFKGNTVSAPNAMDTELVYKLKQLLLMKVIGERNSNSKVYKELVVLVDFQRQ